MEKEYIDWWRIINWNQVAYSLKRFLLVFFINRSQLLNKHDHELLAFRCSENQIILTPFDDITNTIVTAINCVWGQSFFQLKNLYKGIKQSSILSQDLILLSISSASQIRQTPTNFVEITSLEYLVLFYKIDNDGWKESNDVSLSQEYVSYFDIISYWVGC